MIYQSKHNPNAHLTVKERENPSLPTRILLERKLLKGTILDFGCGLGIDTIFLRKKGFDVIAYDPHYSPIYPTEKFDTIICNYVLNVLLPKEQSHVLMAVSELLKPEGIAYFSVRRDITRSGFRYNPKRNCEVYQCNVKLNYPSIFRSKYAEMYSYSHLVELEKTKSSCPLCNSTYKNNLITESGLFYSIHPNFQEGNKAIIIPKFHKSHYELFSNKQQTAAWIVIERTKFLLKKTIQKCPFNIEIEVSKSGHLYFQMTEMRV